jgi:dienelactone hydrolase
VGVRASQVTPVVDWAVSRPEIDSRRIGLLGMSQGGYFAPRAAAFEDRLAACIAWDGVFDVYEAILAQIPRLARDQVDHDHAPVLDALLQLLMHIDPGKRWAVTNGMWTYGASSPREFIQMNRNYTLKAIVHNITCPVLVCEAEKDQFFPGQPKQLYEALTGPKDFIRFTAEEGAEEHCHEGALTLFHQRMFDWLDTTLARAS